MKTNTWSIILAVVVTAVLVGGGVYYWQQSAVSQNTLQGEVSKEEINTTYTPQYDKIEEYLTYSLDEKKSDNIKSSSQPKGFVRIKSGNKDLSIAPKGVDFFEAYVWAMPGWDVGGLEDIQTFYIETVKFDLMKEQEGRSILETAYSTWYGPFQGKLKLLVQ